MYMLYVDPPLLTLDSVVTGIILICVVLLILITLMATGYYFILKQLLSKKGMPVVSIFLNLILKV